MKHAAFGTPKKSFLGFACTRCKRPITALTLQVDVETPAFKPGHTIELECRECRHQARYALDQITRFEEHQIH